MTAAHARSSAVRYSQIEWRDGAGGRFPQYQDGALAYAQGQMKPFNGTATEFFPDGSKSLEGHFRSGQLHGEETWWHAGGQKHSVVTYRRGMRHGAHCVWYEDGRLQIEVQYRKGLRHGPHTVYYPDGRKRSQAVFKDDHLHGLYTTWFEDGSLRSERKFKQGVEMRHREWSSNGEQKVLNHWKPNGGAR